MDTGLFLFNMFKEIRKMAQMQRGGAVGQNTSLMGFGTNGRNCQNLLFLL